VQIDKQQILELLRSQGQQDQAQQADSELPDQVDTDQHAGLLSKYGINVQDLISKFGGGGARAAAWEACSALSARPAPAPARPCSGP
jgi:nanoRNase/pAp phosphatase (c-di-AMP/oligoRNAs hydrolase)